MIIGDSYFLHINAIISNIPYINTLFVVHYRSLYFARYNITVTQIVK